MEKRSDRTAWRLLATVSLVVLGVCEGSFLHFQRSFSTAVSEPVQGLPQFITVSYIDDQLFAQYDSNTRKKVPKVSWIKEVEKNNTEYWDGETQISQSNEQIFRRNIRILKNRYNHTEGFHIVQKMYGCELRGDGSTEGYMQYGYDGRDFIAFDKETLTWTAADAQAQLTKRKWDALGAVNQDAKFYLEEVCIAWLKEYLRYGEKSLLRKDPPEVKVTSRADYDKMETLICRADGFYPRDIEVVWTRDGKVWQEETHCGLVAPNSDGTYHTWISIKVDPKDKDRFRCQVDHASWKDPVDFAVEEPASIFPLWLLVSCAVGIFILVSAVALLFLKKGPKGYTAASRSGKT